MSKPPKTTPTGWYAPAPRLGSKRARAGRVGALIAEHDPQAVVIPFGGYLNELTGLPIACRVAAAEQDEATRGVLEAAAADALETAATIAFDSWVARVFRSTVDPRNEEHVRKVYFSLRDRGDALAPVGSPAWTVLMSACAISGHWRRNQDGAFNIAMGQYMAHWPLGRITPRPFLLAADGWASAALADGKPRLSVYADGFALLDKLKQAKRPSRVFLSIDPPFGNNQDLVYGQAWDKEESIVRLVSAVAALLDGPLSVAGVIWCDDGQKAVWDGFAQLDGRIEWHRDAAKRRIGAGTSHGCWFGELRP